MQDYEKIGVNAIVEHGETICVCKAEESCHKTKDGKKLRGCRRLILLRDRFKGWRSTMSRDRFGK